MMLAQTTYDEELLGGVVRIAVLTVLGVSAWWISRRLSWPRPFRISFLFVHIATAVALSSGWLIVTHVVATLLLTGHLGLSFRYWNEYLFLGCVAYMFVVGPSYAAQASARVARAEAATANAHLATLRAQLHPHFLFNALHTVVQLIPTEPERASEAAELVAGLLRTSINEQRDEVLLDDEWRFVSGYLAVEQIRFGERLLVRSEIPSELLDERVPSFALQTLVENAVQHGAALRVAPTEIIVNAAATARHLTLTVSNSGDVNRTAPEAGAGTGLARLRERLTVMYGDAAQLTTRARAEGGYEATLAIPLAGRARA